MRRSARSSPRWPRWGWTLSTPSRSSARTRSDAFQSAAELRAFLTMEGLDLSGQQQTKTKTALEYVAAGLMHAEKADAG